MSRNETYISARPEEVFDVLATPSTYSEWVVGSSEIHRSDSAWPAEGSIFEHSQGLRPLRVHDTTRVLESDPPHLLVLEVRIRPFMIGRVEFGVFPAADGTRVVMHEEPIGGFARVIMNPGLDLMLKVRNAETLRRLRNVVLERGARRGAG